MSLVAVCPGCHSDNLPSNTQCDICGTALGATIVQSASGSNWKWLAVAAVATTVLFLPTFMLELHPTFMLVVAFYGAMLASYWSKVNVVLEAALGGLAGMVGSFAIVLVINWDVAKAVGKGLGGSASAFTGFVLVLVAVFPVSLMGACAGELLNLRRHHAAQQKMEVPILD